MNSISIETVIAKQRNVDAFLDRICKHIDKFRASRNVRYWYDLDQITLVEFYVDQKAPKYSIFSKNFEFDFSEYVFLPAFINKIGEHKIPYFFHDDSLYVEDFSCHQMRILVTVYGNLSFCFEFREECKCFMLVRMSLHPKFSTDNKYKLYKEIEPYKSVRTW